MSFYSCTVFLTAQVLLNARFRSRALALMNAFMNIIRADMDTDLNIRNMIHWQPGLALH